MKNKGLKVLSLSLLLSTLCVAGCSCSDKTTNTVKLNDSEKAFLDGLSKDASDLTLQDLYNALISNDAGNKASADKLVATIGSQVLEFDKKEESKWFVKYNKNLDEKLKEDQDSDDYLVNGQFNEELFVATLRSQGYNIPLNEDGTYDYSKYLASKYEVETISNLLKQKYIEEESLKDKKTIIDKKKIRDVQYISISSSVDDEYDAYKVKEDGEDKEKEVDISARNFMFGVIDAISADKDNPESNINSDDYFNQFEEQFRGELVKSVETEISKINTSDDYSNSIFAKYTNNFAHSVEEGKRLKMEEINNLEYSFNKVISVDTKEDEVVSSTITTRLLNLAKPEENTKSAYKIGDWYYLVSSQAGLESGIDTRDILLTETSDSSTYTYSIVRFKVINKDNYSSEENLTRVIEHLAKNSTLGGGAVAFYLEKNKNSIVVKDDSIYKYLKALYPDVFTD